MVRGKEERLPCKRQETDSTHGCPSISSAFGAAPAELTIMVSGRLILPRPPPDSGVGA